MTVPVAYTEASPGIPPLNGVLGSGVTLFDYLLTNNNYEIAATDTNKRIYRTLNSGYARPYIRIEDTAQYLKIRCGEGYSDIDTLTNPTPTVAQKTNGLYLKKSSTADSTARPFAAYITDRLFIVLTAFSATNVLHHAILYIGEYETRLPAELGQYNWCMIGGFDNAMSNIVAEDGVRMKYLDSIGGMFLPRPYTLGSGTPLWTKVWGGDQNLYTSGTYLGTPVPGNQEADPVSGGLLGPLPTYIYESNCIRGRLYGLWEIPWQASLTSTAPPAAPITAANLPGREFKMFRNIYAGNYVIETTDWHFPLVAEEV